MVADHESYRTFQAFPTPSEALTFAQQLVGDMLGVFLAGQEWRRLGEGLGHSPLRQDLQFGLSHHGADVRGPSDSRGIGRFTAPSDTDHDAHTEWLLVPCVPVTSSDGARRRRPPAPASDAPGHAVQAANDRSPPLSTYDHLEGRVRAIPTNSHVAHSGDDPVPRHSSSRSILPAEQIATDQISSGPQPVALARSRYRRGGADSGMPDDRKTQDVAEQTHACSAPRRSGARRYLFRCLVAKTAAWVRRSRPSLANRLLT